MLSLLGRLVPAVLALCLAAGTLPARAEASIADAEDLACKAGLCQQIDAMRQQMLDSIDELAASTTPLVDAEVMQRMRTVADHAYAAERLRKNLMHELAQRLDEKDVPALRHWFDSPAGRLIAKAEQSNADLDLGAPVKQGSEILARSTPARRQLIADLMRESRTAEAMVDIIINTTLAVRSGIVIASPNRPHGDTRELRASLEGNRAAMIKSFSTVSLPIMASSYAEVSDADLGSYLSFMRSEAGARFNAVSLQAFERALMIAASEFGQAIPAPPKELNT